MCKGWEGQVYKDGSVMAEHVDEDTTLDSDEQPTHRRTPEPYVALFKKRKPAFGREGEVGQHIGQIRGKRKEYLPQN